MGTIKKFSSLRSEGKKFLVIAFREKKNLHAALVKNDENNKPRRTFF